MNGKQIKLIRSQLRNVVQEIINDVLTNELVAAVQKSVQEQVQKRLDNLFEQHAFAMKQFDERLKETSSYILRNTSNPTVPPTESIEPPQPDNAA